jgi:hypothetical protein
MEIRVIKGKLHAIQDGTITNLPIFLIIVR